MGLTLWLLAVSCFLYGNNGSFYHLTSYLWIQQSCSGSVDRWVTRARTIERMAGFLLIPFLYVLPLSYPVFYSLVRLLPSDLQCFYSVSACCDFRLSEQFVFFSWPKSLLLCKWMDHNFTGWLSSRLACSFVYRRNETFNNGLQKELSDWRLLITGTTYKGKL